MFTVYVLYSFSADRLYIGMTSDLITRFKFHNYKATKGFTTMFRPWFCIVVETYQSKHLARNREKFLKSGNGWYKSKRALSQGLF
ncbi:MAG: GIY-YIG nuclease family protein [Lunatimonas sp.]|uniref:GIY-YIG nuclease family protein n=1 Tax=Lunatimonas sp. TaxID=2060141 RepID=UPI00263A633B|nr:GIY-YIG nuclease family protein [Lunatimonas sp.]MCC5937995.1 GIY-YIG nuclease family protein [Lunatimonas sp.]